MPTTTLKPKTTKGGSATKPSLTNASAEKSRKMLEQMLAKKLSSSTKVPKTMTIKTGATKKSTATRSASGGQNDWRDHEIGIAAAAAAAAKANGSPKDPQNVPPVEANAVLGEEITEKPTPGATERLAAEPGSEIEEVKTKTFGKASENASEKFAKIRKSMTFQCDMIEPEPHKGGGYRKNGTYVKKSSCGMSSKRPMSATPTKKSSCGTVSAKKPMSAKPRPKTAKK
jgi:hypothetical protein